MNNPFVELTSLIPVGGMQAYVALMFALVVLGTIADMVHKKSARYFFLNGEAAKKKAKRQLSGGEKFGLAMKTVTNEVLTSSEFQNPRRRASHLLMMYGFILFVISTVVMIFSLPEGGKGVWPLLWHLGALMVAIGSLWFWFFIRVDVFAEGIRWYHLRRADMFVVSLMTMSIFALIWSFSGMTLFFWLFIAAATFLFASVPWSKFAHMFFKPAAAFDKKVAWASGYRENLPDVPDLSSPETHKRFPDIPKYMGENPPNMGLGIKRERPNHY